MLPLTRERRPQVLRAVAPLLAMVGLLQLTIVGAAGGLVPQFLAGR